MRRREFISLVGAVAMWPLAVRAQEPGKALRIGFLFTGSLESPEGRMSVDALRQGLHEHGYIEGQNIVVEYRAAEGRFDRLPALASELVQLKVDLILATATPAGRATQQVTTTIPIVVTAMGDPVHDGLVASLARPGGNITGTTFLGPELVPKRLTLLKEGLPTVSRVGVLWDPGAFGEATIRNLVAEVTQAAEVLSLQPHLVAARKPDEIDGAFDSIIAERAQAVFVFPSSMLFSQRRRVVELITRHALPATFPAREYAQLGGLMAYGANITELWRRSAFYVERIFKGTKPSELPVEQPTKFELVINLKTARALGLDVPPPLLARADEVIE
jgi:putative tryptophan/tyrosine transport system substrate-binding protein